MIRSDLCLATFLRRSGAVPVLFLALAALGGCGDKSIDFAEQCFFPSPYKTDVRNELRRCAAEGNVGAKVLLANALHKEGDVAQSSFMYSEIERIPDGSGLIELSRISNFSGLKRMSLLSRASAMGNVDASAMIFSDLNSEGQFVEARRIVDASPSARLGALAAIARSSGHQDKSWRAAWSRRAAASGDAKSMHAYAAMLEAGVGVRVDKAAAARWYLKALKKAQTPESLIDAARVMHGDLGGPRDPKRSLDLYRQALSMLPYSGRRLIEDRISSLEEEIG